MTPPPPGLQATGLRHRYGRREILCGLDLSVAPGELVGLLGPNGAGKTTAFKILAGLLRPDAGRVTLAGQDLTGWPLWRRARAGLGYLPQEPTVFRRLSARANVEVGLSRQGLDRAARRATAQALLEAAQLGHLAALPGARLSGGERRRLEITRALAAKPRILLVDEPFAGLDPLAVHGVRQRLQALAAEGVGILLTDHQVVQALEACHRVYILADGGPLFVGTPADAAGDAAVRARYLGPVSGAG